MIKTIIRAMYSAFIFIVLFSIILTGWTGYAFISQPTNSDEIINCIKNIGNIGIEIARQGVENGKYLQYLCQQLYIF